MLAILFHIDIFREVSIGIIYITNLILFVIAISLFKKSRAKITGTLGASLFTFGLAFQSFQGDLTFLYSNEITFLSILSLILLTIFGQLLIILVERDLRIANKPIIRVTPISIVYSIFFISSIVIAFVIDKFDDNFLGVIMIGNSIAWFYIGYKYISFLSGFEVVRRQHPTFWTLFGFSLVGFSFYILIFRPTYQLLLIKDILILFGSLCILYSWKTVPDVSELDWMLALKRLIIIESKSSLCIYDFIFQKPEKNSLSKSNLESKSFQTDSHLIAGAMGGINSLIGEILESAGGLDEISYSNFKILFHRRSQFICLLISDKSKMEIKYRLETFGINFEKTFFNELTNFYGEVSPFEKAEKLVKEIFK